MADIEYCLIAQHRSGLAIALRRSLTADPTAAASSSDRPERLAVSVSVLLRNFLAIFRRLNGYNAYPVRVRGIESGNATPCISIKAITPPHVT